MEKFFKLRENNTNIKQEAIAGITTFLTMAYIIAVNPNILGTTGMPQGALVTATCLAAGLTTILMGLYANLPFALASGMGLNAFFAYSVCGNMHVSWQIALTAVLVEGIIFIVLSLTKVREAVVDTIPMNLKYAVTAGIGLFITFIGFSDAGIVVPNASTFVSLGNFVTPNVLIAVIGIIIIAVMSKKNVRGSMLWGILICAILGWIYAAMYPQAASYYKIYPLPKKIFEFKSISPIAFKFDFSYAANPQTFWSFVTVMFTFLFVDFFDTVGTLVGVASKANMLDKDGKVPKAGRALLVDAVGTTLGACLGVSTVTTYVESSAGVAEGGRTGLTSIITGLLFLIAMFFAPLFIAIPSCATAPALIVVGFLMIGNIVKVDFSDYTEGIPAFLTVAMMPLTYSIGDGLTMGILSYTVLNVINNIFTKDSSKKKKISPVMYVLAVIFIIKLVMTGLQASGYKF